MYRCCGPETCPHRDPIAAVGNAYCRTAAQTLRLPSALRFRRSWGTELRMESQLAFDSRAKQLNLAFKERFVTDSNFQLKITGNVNTQTGRSPSPLNPPPHVPHPFLWCDLISPLAVGSVSYQGFLGKFFLAKPRSSSGYALAADKKQLRLGAGKHLLVIVCTLTLQLS